MLHHNIIVDVENVVSLFSSPSTSSQKVRKCGGHNFLFQVIECGSSTSLAKILKLKITPTNSENRTH